MARHTARGSRLARGRIAAGLALGTGLAACGGGSHSAVAHETSTSTAVNPAVSTTTVPPTTVASTSTTPAASTTTTLTRPTITTTTVPKPSVAAPTAPTASAASQPKLLAISEDTPTYEPTEFNFTGDDTGYVDGLRWTKWDASGAIGVGTLHLNDCMPACYNGTFSPYPTTVTLSAAMHTASGYLFTALKISDPTAPSGSDDYTIPR